jgi:L-lactate dehydrogenase (cytochrome)
VDALARGPMGLIEYVNEQFDRSITWPDVEWLAAQWNGPFIVKGVQSVEDARAAKAAGATAIMISNHGGRQLDGAPTPIELLEPIRQALGAGIELVVDGGVRRGSDVVKALCLGADACSIGRAYLYGLGAAGYRGVADVLSILMAEMARTMTLLGCPDVDALTRARVG